METTKKKLALALVGLLAVGAAHGDTLRMKNGSVLVGKLITAEDDKVVFETPFAGRITIKEANIDELVTDADVTLMLEDGEVLRERSIVTEVGSGQLTAQRADDEPVTFNVADIRYINPDPWKLGDGWNWSGNVRAALEAERGNSDSDEWDADGRMEWRSLMNRFVVRGDAELEESNNEKTSENWELRTKYDRFVRANSPNYFGGKVRFEYDKFADLDLRTIVGPHIGRQFLNRPILRVQGELGPVWVDEQFDVAEDNDFPGALWEFEITSNVLGFGTELYALHDGILNFDDTEDLILNTTLGIKMPLILGFQTGFEAEWEYDGGAVEGVDDLDETYNFFIAYEW